MEVPRLHVVTPAAEPAALLGTARTVLASGAPLLQLRQKDVPDRIRLATALALTDLCREHGARLVVNDRPDVAVAAGADGVHVGDDDLPVDAARAVVGPDRLVGATCRDPEGARAAAAAGASYLGAGPAYATATKDGLPDPLGPEGVGAVARAVDLPVIAIAGVTAERVGELLAAGAHGVAVVGAVWQADDPAAALRRLLAALGEAAPDRPTRSAR